MRILLRKGKRKSKIVLLNEYYIEFIEINHNVNFLFIEDNNGYLNHRYYLFKIKFIHCSYLILKYSIMKLVHIYRNNKSENRYIFYSAIDTLNNSLLRRQ